MLTSNPAIRLIHSQYANCSALCNSLSLPSYDALKRHQIVKQNHQASVVHLLPSPGTPKSAGKPGCDVNNGMEGNDTGEAIPF